MTRPTFLKKTVYSFKDLGSKATLSSRAPGLHDDLEFRHRQAQQTLSVEGKKRPHENSHVLIKKPGHRAILRSLEIVTGQSGISPWTHQSDRQQNRQQDLHVLLVELSVFFKRALVLVFQFCFFSNKETMKIEGKIQLTLLFWNKYNSVLY